MSDDLLEICMSRSNQALEAQNQISQKLLDESVLSSDSGYFPIRDLSLKTGVNSVTLRAWERRYGLLKPKRTEKGHRLYDQADVQRVEAILRWVQQGVAVSKVRALLEQGGTLEGMVLSSEWLEWQESLIHAAEMFQADKVEQIYQQVFSQYPAEIAIRDWLLPSFEQLGKGATLAFCESIILSCLMARQSGFKVQKKSLPKVLITGLASQRIVWCYMAAAILLDKGVSCRVIPNIQYSQDWSSLVEALNPRAVLIFCENELVNKIADFMQQTQQWQRPVGVISPSFWLAVRESAVTDVAQVRVYSELLEGVADFLEKAL